jgi:hypothetical protein
MKNYNINIIIVNITYWKKHYILEKNITYWRKILHIGKKYYILEKRGQRTEVTGIRCELDCNGRGGGGGGGEEGGGEKEKEGKGDEE